MNLFQRTIASPLGIFTCWRSKTSTHGDETKWEERACRSQKGEQGNPTCRARAGIRSGAPRTDQVPGVWENVWRGASGGCRSSPLFHLHRFEDCKWSSAVCWALDGTTKAGSTKKVFWAGPSRGFEQKVMFLQFCTAFSGWGQHPNCSRISTEPSGCMPMSRLPNHKPAIRLECFF